MNVLNQTALSRYAIAALSLVCFAQAQAESRISGAMSGPLSATAKVNFQVNVPRILYLRVGNAGATINTVTLDMTVNGGGLAPTNNAVQTLAMPNVPAWAATDDNGTTTDGAVSVQLWTNNGTSTLTCSGAALTAGANTIPLSSMGVTNSGTGTLPHPGTSLACVAASRGAAGVNDLNDTWMYGYNQPTLPAPGNYTTTVTYTASQP